MQTVGNIPNADHANERIELRRRRRRRRRRPTAEHVEDAAGA